MRPFAYEAVSTIDGAVQAGARDRANFALQSSVHFLAGGTTLIDLMKLDVMRPQYLVDINTLENTDLNSVEFTAQGLRLGALVRMADAADHPEVHRNFPAIARISI